MTLRPHVPAISRRELAGIGLITLAVICFATLDTATKVVTAQVPLFMAAWIRHVIQALFSTAVAWPRYGVRVVQTGIPGTHVLRGLLMLVVTFLAFASLRFMPVGEFSAIIMTVPLLVTLLSSRMLGEHVSPLRVLLVAGGFIGTLVIVRPGSDFLGWAFVLPLLLVLCNTAFQLLTSRMTRTENALTTQFYTSWVCVIFGALPLYWVWVDIDDPRMWTGLLVMGLAGGAGHFFLIKSFERARAVTLMPFMYLQIAFGMLGGWLMFGHLPDAWSMTGITLIAACGIASGALTVRENRVLRAT